DYFVFSPGRMKRKHNTFYFIDENNKQKSLPIHQINDIYVFGVLDMNTRFLQMLNQHEVSLHIFNYYGFYSGTFYPRNKRVSGFTAVHQSKHHLDQQRRLFIAKQMVGSASFHMKRNLRRYQDKPFVKEVIDNITEYQDLLENMTTI